MTELPAPPPSVGKLEKYVLAYAAAEGLAVGRVRHWISFMMLSGALDRATNSAGAKRFVVKGGVALELGLRGRARTTDDLDVVVIAAEEDLASALDEALETPYQGCTFTRRPNVYQLADKSVRVSVQIDYRSQRWATVQVDLAGPDAIDMETEQLGGIPLVRFGLSGPTDVVCLSLRYHIAQKFHGMTKGPQGRRENDRFRDAVDLLLLRDLVADDDLPTVRVACEETFQARREHAWPPTIALPESWRAPFAAMAESVGLVTTDLSDAERALQTFVDDLLTAEPP
ncbi:MAG: nucleotidyl transferase AbiEii/AbiGii toxin family protein [Gemmatimonadota bacterium]